jgi:membrane associated rhomboid family serine protease
MQLEKSQKPSLGDDNNSLVALLAINLIVFVMMGLLKVIYYLESLPIEQYYNQIYYPFTLQSDWINRPWTILVYNWVHEGFWVLFANMVWLSFFSNILQSNGANKHIFPIYFYCGLLSPIPFMFLASNQPLIGSAACVTGIVFACVWYQPNYKILSSIGVGIPVWFFGLLYIILQGYSLIEAPMAIHLCILLGGLIGIFYIMLLKKGKDLGKWMHQLLHLLNNSLSPKTNG